MIGIGLLTLTLVTLVATAPANDKMNKIPVNNTTYRDIPKATIPASIQDILMSNLKIEPFTTSSFNQSTDPVIKILSPSGSTEVQAALLSLVQIKT